MIRKSQFFQKVSILAVLVLTGCSYSQKRVNKLYEKARIQQYDVVVIPGVPLENGKWSQVMKARVLWSKHLFERGIAKNVMYSGGAVYSPYVEAEVMALYGEAIGIPKEHIYAETLAEHSTENIYYSYKKAQQLGFKKVALASDPFQTKMLQRFTRLRVNKDVDMVPMIYDSVYVLDQAYGDPVIDYHKTQVDSFVPRPERKNFWTRFRGTMGRKIDESAYETN